MNSLFKKALLKADEVRTDLGLDMFEPVNIFDACIEMRLTIRFMDINMEGMYVAQADEKHPTILLSSLRPLPRRSFTCAHELGHHVFKHGTKIDMLSDQDAQYTSDNNDEFLVDCFAGALLMPIAGVQAEFAKRNWPIAKATPLQFYTISSVFGIGYETLIVHCKANGLIKDSQVSILRKLTPGKILKTLFPSGIENTAFKVIDGLTQLATIDLEVGNIIILPSNYIVEGNHLEKIAETSAGSGYKAVRTGIVRTLASDDSNASFIRIQNAGYVGLAENRHLETV